MIQISDIHRGVPIGVKNDTIGSVIPASLSLSVWNSPEITLRCECRINRDNSLTENPCLILQNSSEFAVSPLAQTAIHILAFILILETPKPFYHNNIGFGLQNLVDTIMGKVLTHVTMFTTQSFKFPSSRMGILRLQPPFVKTESTKPFVEFLPGNKDSFSCDRRTFDTKVNADTRSDCFRRLWSFYWKSEPKFLIPFKQLRVLETVFDSFIESWIRNYRSFSSSTKRSYRDFSITNTIKPLIQLHRKFLLGGSFRDFLFVTSDGSIRRNNVLFRFNDNLTGNLLRLANLSINHMMKRLETLLFRKISDGTYIPSDTIDFKNFQDSLLGKLVSLKLG